MMTRPKSNGLSLIDVVALIVLVAVFATIVMLRVSGSRESARRMECEDNLRKVFVAVESYSLRYGHFPIGTQDTTSPIRSEAVGYHQNWISGLLPMMERQALYEQIDFSRGVYAPENESIGTSVLPELMCPTATSTLLPNATSYAGVTSSTERPIDEFGDGMFILNRPLAQRDARDGAGFVWLIGEKSLDVATPTQWNSGTRASLRNGGSSINATVAAGDIDPLFVGGFSSNHPGGAYFLFVDGSFRFFADQTDPQIRRQMAGRADTAAETADAKAAVNADPKAGPDAAPDGATDGGKNGVD